MGRRFSFLVLCAVVITAGLSVATSSQAKTSQPPTLAANIAAARVDAAQLLIAPAIPTQAVRLSAEPAGDNGYLKPATQLVATPSGVVDTAWWQTAAQTPAQLIAAVSATPPAGVFRTAATQSGNLFNETGAQGVLFLLTPTPGVLAARIIEITATTLTGGDTGVMVQSESIWIVPRTAASIVPAATRIISISETHAGKTVRSATITAPSRVRAGVSFFNGLEAAQPGATNCGLESASADLLTVRFLARRGAAPLATASFSGTFGRPGSGVSTACAPISLRVASTAQDPLIGGNYVAALNRLFGTRFPG